MKHTKKAIPTFVEFWITAKVIQEAKINTNINSDLWFAILIVMIRILKETMQKQAQIHSTRKEMQKYLTSSPDSFFLSCYVQNGNLVLPLLLLCPCFLCLLARTFKRSTILRTEPILESKNWGTKNLMDASVLILRGRFQAISHLTGFLFSSRKNKEQT